MELAGLGHVAGEINKSSRTDSPDQVPQAIVQLRPRHPHDNQPSGGMGVHPFWHKDLSAPAHAKNGRASRGRPAPACWGWDKTTTTGKISVIERPSIARPLNSRNFSAYLNFNLNLNFRPCLPSRSFSPRPAAWRPTVRPVSQSGSILGIWTRPRPWSSEPCQKSKPTV